MTDVWAEDLTLPQLKRLRCRQRKRRGDDGAAASSPLPHRTHMYDGLFPIVTLKEHLQVGRWWVA